MSSRSADQPGTAEHTPDALGRRGGQRAVVAPAAVASWIVALLLLGVLELYPFGTLVMRSLSDRGGWSLAAYGWVVTAPQSLDAIRRSLIVCVPATALATLIGLGFAWLVARTDLPGRRWLRPLLAMPYFIPSFIGAIAWLQLIGPVGYLTQGLMLLLGTPQAPFRIYGPWGMGLLFVLHYYPLVYLAVLSALDRLDPALEQAARASGAGRWQTVTRVTLPMVAPVTLTAAAIVFATSLADFGIAAIMGLPANYVVVTTRIFALVRSFDLQNNFALAAALSAPLVLFSLLTVAAQARLLGEWTPGQTIRPAGEEPAVELGRGSRRALAGLCWVWTMLVLVLPILAILIAACTKVPGLPAVPGNLTLQNFVSVLGAPEARRGLLNSVALAAGAATTIVVLGSWLALWTRDRATLATALNLVCAAPYAIPGIVLALAMIMAWLQPIPLLGWALYGTLWIIFLAYVARFLTFGYRFALAAVRQLDRSLGEAARAAGATPIQALGRITLPLIRAPLLTAWLLVFAPALTELTVSILLWSAGRETLGVVVYNLQDSGSLTGAAALAVCVLLLLAPVQLAAQRLARGKVGV